MMTKMIQMPNNHGLLLQILPKCWTQKSQGKPKLPKTLLELISNILTKPFPVL